MPKLEDVAKRANLSKTTVSRVLNNRGYLSQKTIDKVYQAMEELNYHPNVVARQLYKNKTDLIGILLPTVANPFFGELTAFLEDDLYQQGFKVLIGNSMNNPQKEADYLQQLLIKQVDGLIVGTHNQGIEQYHQSGLPIVAIDRIMNEDIPVIASDNYRGGILATERLIERGAKKIIHTNGPNDLETPAKRRREAYEQVMKAHNLSPITYEVDFNITPADKVKILRRIFLEHPDVEAIFASNDTDAAQIMQIAQNLGRQIPRDLLLIGYDGTQIVRELLPQLTTVIQPIDQMAKKSVAVLKQRLAQESTKKEYLLPVKLQEGTTG
ncbi:LacI family DNA-binding transcriptional regulator [Xylocopilactobacillus apicola]|uniref:LacI family transcriptional regulator n=1 Tax=Xylocopilactobacillus apicola TaxID=2932184 RepID=A0AAU9DRG1_9LACO|nr:LacI family DNA-binding transcriptional regulator [Xylocopilactobacillus apicola]BDR58534.1 LacI family transcriptional regulator [Xylocopilactobacillus apicola]BDR58556.1 LacI family transcriptional regulator [Xylocopilactobacillus apicola]